MLSRGDSMRKEKIERILSILKKSEKPVSGSEIAKVLGVSRQAVVQYIAFMKEEGYNVVATPRGYVLKGEGGNKKLIAVKHRKEDIYDELMTVVKLGGKVCDVIVEHPVYGEIRGMIDVASEEDVVKFVSLLASAKAEPLLSLSDGVHLHTIEVKDEETFKKILKALSEKGYLLREEMLKEV